MMPMLSNLKSYRKLALIVGIFSAIVLGGTLFLVYPVVSGITSTAADIANKKAMVASSDTVTRQLLDMKEHSQDYAPNFTILEKTFVDSTDPLDFITFLESTAANNSVAIDIKLANQQQKSATASGLLGFQMLATGSFGDVISFIQEIEKGPYLVDIQQTMLQVKPQDETKTVSPDVVQANISLGVVTR